MLFFTTHRVTNICMPSLSSRISCWDCKRPVTSMWHVISQFIKLTVMASVGHKSSLKLVLNLMLHGQPVKRSPDRGVASPRGATHVVGSSIDWQTWCWMANDKTQTTYQATTHPPTEHTSGHSSQLGYIRFLGTPSISRRPISVCIYDVTIITVLGFCGERIWLYIYICMLTCYYYLVNKVVYNVIMWHCRVLVWPCPAPAVINLSLS